MKKIILILFVLSALSLTGFSQCDKKVIYTASLAAMSHGTGSPMDTLREKILVQTNKTEVKLTHSDREDDALKGTVKKSSCEWTEAFRNGRSVLSCELTEPNGHISNGTLTIEAKNGKILITLEMKDEGEGVKIFQIFVDSFKETV